MEDLIADELKARMLIEAASSALAAGIIHRNKAGKVLTTPKQVLQCLLDEGGVELEDPRTLKSVERGQ